MGKQKETALEIPAETIREKIYQIRGRKVMLDSDLAELYGVETKHWIRQVRPSLRLAPCLFNF